MPSISIKGCNSIKTILECMEDSANYHFLICETECYALNWQNEKKWNTDILFLTENDLKKDIWAVDPSFIWGIFSAIDQQYTKNEVLAYPLPSLQGQKWNSNRIVPQHPLASLEITFFDGWQTIICAHDEKFLKPFYSLPYVITDEEASNRQMNTILRKIQNVLRHAISNVSPEIANEVQWHCWHTLFQNKEEEPDAALLKDTILRYYEQASEKDYVFRYSMWDPYSERDI